MDKNEGKKMLLSKALLYQQVNNPTLEVTGRQERVSADVYKTASMKVRNIPVLCLLFLQSSAGSKREW